MACEASFPTGNKNLVDAGGGWDRLVMIPFISPMGKVFMQLAVFEVGAIIFQSCIPIDWTLYCRLWGGYSHDIVAAAVVGWQVSANPSASTHTILT